MDFQLLKSLPASSFSCLENFPKNVDMNDHKLIIKILDWPAWTISNAKFSSTLECMSKKL